MSNSANPPEDSYTLKIANNLSLQHLQKRASEREKDEGDPRGKYFRDATAILHSTPFRRLKHKTQVFFFPQNDHICTRLEHVLHVASIAVSICKGLGLDSDLAWAIGLGHDLGHAPFGHLGERVLRELTGEPFHHELQSLRVVDKLYDLNLCFAVRDGIVSHCGEEFEQSISPTHIVNAIEDYKDITEYPATYEGCVVRMADKIAYLGRDYEDAVSLGIIPENELPLNISYVLGSDSNSSIINSFAKDLIAHTEKTGKVGFSDGVYDALKSFKEYNYREIYHSKNVDNEGEKLKKLLEVVFQNLKEFLQRGDSAVMYEMYEKSDLQLVRSMGRHIQQHGHLYDLKNDKEQNRLLMDYISSMTDNFIIANSKELLYPHTVLSHAPPLPSQYK